LKADLPAPFGIPLRSAVAFSNEFDAVVERLTGADAFANRTDAIVEGGGFHAAWYGGEIGAKDRDETENLLLPFWTCIQK
jgi:hypothetical protein